MIILRNFLLTVIFSISYVSKAYDCPDIKELQKIIIMESDMVQLHGTDINRHPKSEGGKWYTKTFVGNLGTGYIWQFTIENITAENKEEALNKAQGILKNLNAQGRGFKYWLDASWMCSYLPSSRVSNLTATAVRVGPVK